MTLLGFAAVAAILVGQQPAPLVSQTELRPPAAVEQQAPAENAGQQTVQEAPRGPSAQQQQSKETPIRPIKPSDRREAAGKNETKGPGAKRVVAFWVILPEKTK